jgi:hypothetical protein
MWQIDRVVARTLTGCLPAVARHGAGVIGASVEIDHSLADNVRSKLDNAGHIAQI